MTIRSLLDSLGPEIQDAEEESFLLFSQSIPSQNLGFVDSKATVLDLTINGHDLSIHQSPTILSSNRSGGTTGAVVWKITPLLATWLSSSTSPLTSHSLLTPQTNVLELGCGISGIIGLTLSPLVHTYLLTDQAYVSKLLNLNLTANISTATSSKARKTKRNTSSSAKEATAQQESNVTFHPLDWETDSIANLPIPSTTESGFDVVLASDCIYNAHLIPPLVQTLFEAASLRSQGESVDPTLCIVAQQLRSDEIFESWLGEFMEKGFRVWRVPDEMLVEGLREGSGFVVHFGVLRV